MHVIYLPLLKKRSKNNFKCDFQIREFVLLAKFAKILTKRILADLQLLKKYDGEKLNRLN